MTDIHDGMIKGLGLGVTSNVRTGSIGKDKYRLATKVIQDLTPKHGYLYGVMGWSGVWGTIFMEAGIPYTLILPYPGIGSHWHPSNRILLTALTSKADEVIYIADQCTHAYPNKIFMDMNDYLVAHSDGIVSFINYDAGTESTCSYICKRARELGKPVRGIIYRGANLYDRHETGIDISGYRT